MALPGHPGLPFCASTTLRPWALIGPAAVALAVLFAGCSGGGSTPGAPASLSASAEDSPAGDSLEPSPSAEVATDGELRFLTADGVTLTGRVFGAGTVGVVMAHESGGSSNRWDSLAPAMAGEGYRVLAFNPRGHVGSGGEPGGEATQDVLAAIAYLRDESLSRVIVVGVGDAGIGALEAATESPAVIGVVSIAPAATDAHDRTRATIEGLTIPTLLIATTADAEPARQLAELLDDRDLTLFDTDLPDGDLLAGPVGPHLWARLDDFVERTAR